MLFTGDGLVVNTRALGRRLSGVERYTSELLRCLPGRLRSERPNRTGSGLAGHLWEQLVLPAQLKSDDLLWSPANTGPLGVANQVLTLHDTSVLENPHWYRPAFARWYGWLMPRLVRKVRQVLTVSEYSRERILKTFSLPAERVSVIPCGVNLKQFGPAQTQQINRLRAQYGLPLDYLLFLGTREPRKNLSRLLLAWDLIQGEFPRMPLVIAGGQIAHFAAEVPAVNRPGVLFTGYVPENQLQALYSGARLLLLPSLSEGFGLAALEAMACGTPVLAADAGALPEIIGSAGRLLDPLDVVAWAQEMRSLLKDPDCLKEYSRRGLARAQDFSWENSASQVWSVLEAAQRAGVKTNRPLQRNPL